MQLRPVLAVVLIVALGIGISFLLPSIVPDDGPPSVTTVEKSDWSNRGRYHEIDDSTTTVLRVGRRSEVVVVRITNASPSNRRLQLRLDHDETDTRLLDKQRSFRANETLRVNLREPAQYTIHVRDTAMNASKTVTIRTERFDCNEDLVTVRATENGTVEKEWISTAMACG